MGALFCLGTAFTRSLHALTVTRGLLPDVLHLIVGKLVVAALAYTCNVKFQPIPLLVHPADDFTRIANYQGKGGNIFRNNSTCANKGVFANSCSANNCRIGTNGGTFLDQSFGIELRAALGEF